MSTPEPTIEIIFQHSRANWYNRALAWFQRCTLNHRHASHALIRFTQSDGQVWCSEQSKFTQMRPWTEGDEARGYRAYPFPGTASTEFIWKLTGAFKTKVSNYGYVQYAVAAIYRLLGKPVPNVPLRHCSEWCYFVAYICGWDYEFESVPGPCELELALMEEHGIPNKWWRNKVINPDFHVTLSTEKLTQLWESLKSRKE